MSRFIFASDLWQRPEGYEPPAITHDDPLVMTITKALMDADPECTGGWEYQLDGAQQGDDGDPRGEYYAEPYKRAIERYIKLAVAVREAISEDDAAPAQDGGAR